MNMDRLNNGLYWDRAWKLVEGCTPVSAGCDHCWSETETNMRAHHPNATIGERADSVLARAGGFSGRILLREDNLDLPLRTRKPTVWAIWNDLYHADVPETFRDRAYAVMALCPQHTFLVLTKRAERMAAYFENGSVHCWDRSIDALPNSDKITVENTHLECVRDHSDEYVTTEKNWPLPNVWHGVTAENQAAADERIPHLLRVPGQRFLSIEPMLGPVEIPWRVGGIGPVCTSCTGEGNYHDNFNTPCPDCHETGVNPKAIHAVLLGGESGKNARPMPPDWARSVRDQCAAAGVPFFFKQWGEWANSSQIGFHGLHAKEERVLSPYVVYRVGKRAAGRLLDGRTHDDLPWGTK